MRLFGRRQHNCTRVQDGLLGGDRSLRCRKAKTDVADSQSKQLRIGYRTRNIDLSERQRRHFEIRQQALFQSVEIGHGRPAQVEFAARTQRADVVEFEDDLSALIFRDSKGGLVFGSEAYPAELVANFQLS